MEPQTGLLILVAILVLMLGLWMQNYVKPLLHTISEQLVSLSVNIAASSRHQLLKDQYFDLQAREMQKFIEEFLGRDFNVDCKFLKITGDATNQYALWIWKRYETRDMGCMINATSIPEMIKDFMHVYYSTPYFTDATAFPKG